MLENHGDVILAADMMFMQKTPFMVSASRNLKFLTMQKLNNRTLNTIMESIDEILITCNKNKFYIVEMLMDMEFELLHEELKKGNM